MNRDDILKRRADLARQHDQAKAKRREAEELLKEAQRLVDSIDGALQENGYWFDAETRQALDAEAARLRQAVEGEAAELAQAAGGE
jgi:molecular chaperone DnaK (HSP70)